MMNCISIRPHGPMIPVLPSSLILCWMKWCIYRYCYLHLWQEESINHVALSFYIHSTSLLFLGLRITMLSNWIWSANAVSCTAVISDEDVIKWNWAKWWRRNRKRQAQLDIYSCMDIFFILQKVRFSVPEFPLFVVQVLWDYKQQVSNKESKIQA